MGPGEGGDGRGVVGVLLCEGIILGFDGVGYGDLGHWNGCISEEGVLRSDGFVVGWQRS